MPQCHRWFRVACAVGAGLLALAVADPAGAQLDRWVKKAKDKVDRRVEDKVDRAMDGAIDKADPATAGKAQPGGQSGGGEAAQPMSAAAAAKSKPGEGVWLNFDFVPGDRVLYADDFTADRVGNFPQRLEFVEGNMEVAEFTGAARALRMSGNNNVFRIPLPEVLPERFTLEFDLRGNEGGSWQGVKLTGGPRPDWDADGAIVEIARQFARVTGEGGTADYRMNPELPPDQWTRFRLLADGKYIKCYVNEVRWANIPNADFRRAKAVAIQAYASSEDPWFVANLRVAASTTTLYDALMAKGRVATQGILFDVNSDVIRPESTPTLKEIGGMLEKNGELKLLIEGHTDNTGNAEANLGLSQRRADSVRRYLVEQHKIAAERLQTKGLGATNPVADNSTAEGRQNNRRVELVKI